MVTSKPLFGLTDYPRHLRYDWGEDLDEVLQDDLVCFTQCKRIDDVGQPAMLADVLLGFAPKWLWTPLNSRDRVRFRLVSCDQRFRSGFSREDAREDVLDHFKKILDDEPSSKSDRFLWQSDAAAVGFEGLFEALWNNLSLAYLDPTVIIDDPAGVVLSSEAAARDLLLKYGLATASTQKAAIVDLRCVINENLIAFDPTNDDCPSFVTRAPIRLDAADVRFALSDKKEKRRSPSFTLVDRVVLSKARVQPKEKFLFKSPDWHHVIHGTDSDVKFVERDQTDTLREKVRESLIQPLLRGTSNLPVLFVIGPPGAGKSTLVRRVAATLVESGEVVVADAGLNLAGGPNDRRSYAEDLQELSSAGRPVLLVLDDPLFEESGWIDLLVHLKQPGFRVAAIAATPDFLHQRYRSQLSKLSCSEFPVAPPSPQEKQRFAEIYGRDISTFGMESDDFLIMVAEAESGEQFPMIMERLWQTLNGGQPFVDNLSFKELPWEVRAFWFVCFIHRCYTLCPLPNLKAALELSGGTGLAISVEIALAKLKAQSGWNIFRHHSPSASVWSYQGDYVSTAHQKIASVAWNQRPMVWFDSEVDKILAQSTVVEPQSVRNVAIAAGTMAKAEPESQNSFAIELIKQWQKAAAEQQRLETRQLSELYAMLSLYGGRKLVAPMRETMQARAIGKDGWLAAYQLWFISSEDPKSRSFSEDINLASLIAMADFSLAPNRATRLFQQLGSKTELVNAIRQRLFESLEGRLDWDMDSELLGWLLNHAPRDESTKRLSSIVKWLESHDDDSFVRTQYLTFLQGLPETFDEERKQAVADTAKWLARHDDNSHVRTQYLTFLQGLPETFDEERKQAVADTAKWLAVHDDDSTATVRTQYLTFLQGLPAEFDQERKQAVADTTKWLAVHDDDSTATVRTQYLTFLQGLSETLDEACFEAAKATSDWLERHPENYDVRACYVSFLLHVQSTVLDGLRQASDKHHRWLIAKKPNSSHHNFVYGEQLLRLSRFDEAIAQYDIVLNLYNDHQMARRGRGFALQKLGRMPEAEAEFKQALWWARDKKQSQAIFHTSLGEFYLETSRWPDAINSFQQAQKEFPDHFRNHWGIAKAQLGQGNLDEAEDALQRALADPNLKPTAKNEIIQFFDDIRLRRTS